MTDDDGAWEPCSEEEFDTSPYPVQMIGSHFHVKRTHTGSEMPDVLLSAIRGAIGTLGVDASRGLTRQETADLFSVFDRLDSHMMNGGAPPKDWDSRLVAS